MATAPHLAEQADEAPRAVAGSRARRTPTGRTPGGRLTGGGVEGNERLTALTGLILILLLAVLGLTILQIHRLIWLHLFVGLVLLGPVALKMATTGYRFARYYTHDPVYRRKGPPVPLLRLLAPFVVLSTVVVFATGVVLLFVGPSGRGTLLLAHKASFIIWLGVTALHVLAHLPATAGSLSFLRGRSAEVPGTARGEAGRRIALAGALVGGLVLAVVLLPEFAAWTQHGAFFEH